ncbi:13228_t:CDS:2, partial [Acaulospora colombiana]
MSKNDSDNSPSTESPIGRIALHTAVDIEDLRINHFPLTLTKSSKDCIQTRSILVTLQLGGDEDDADAAFTDDSDISI